MSLAESTALFMQQANRVTRFDVELHLKKMPVGVARAVRESGILSEWGANFTWLRDQRMIDILLRADKAHDNMARKAGPEPRLIHEVWCAHQIYNTPPMAKWLRDNNLPLVLGAFCMAAHDLIENEYNLANKKQVAFDRAETVNAIANIWSDPKTFPVIETQCLEYMTDDPSLHKRARIDAQQQKSYNAVGKFQLTFAQQMFRLIDKASHPALDALTLGRQYAQDPKGISEKAKIALRKAEEKKYVLDFPASWAVMFPYLTALRQLKKMSAQQPCNVGHRFFGQLADSSASYYARILAPWRPELALMKTSTPSPLIIGARS